MLFDNHPLVLIIDHMNFIPTIYETKFLIRVKTCHEEMCSMDNVFCTLLVVSSFPLTVSNEGSSTLNPALCVNTGQCLPNNWQSCVKKPGGTGEGTHSDTGIYYSLLGR